MNPLVPRGRVPAVVLKNLLNLWPPYLAAGVHVDYIQRDYSRVHVSMALHWYNRNYVGTHFGGSLYAMTDPFYMLMLIQLLGPDTIVWDKAANIRFRRPGKGRVSALFQISPHEVAALQTELARTGRVDFEKTLRVLDADLMTVAEVDKVVYLKKKTR
ncbi:tetrameric acyl-CoA thioesterase [bacterium (Candidatus Blackallbacteria) CG17_big_fil_post_rev_8_21_14_2_50_48_46]|uniref:Tetrameric acyl-CoA thioesterase n=1 Tax=bacterium (Candidatus Blackallbacteria) CG17_big_fil_post_rev_8_21_14_2_50_48_46 TaxID=2014261 RepID=A0A2M7G879_9BACT|nr:MAG: tetrameric acyl-CoA thioesterase [bacterium (Candidatus Blackallbacteria) CG18_big_fil_WC_8_21_14_2_50_49_26]PIW18272.1 MAG: tetrameric acyl-CoA thioesterase [bacterium (Candidatus Blackallbacteria) CG17_big_fil_post_rev_8_21_14_2_50_48_46]PIW49496.1 MAG: tetrameric acyl-CoA thioesterase [bacterium (Candidatus Blackallbacteria) CG13_big_fil_rev_8_21_14_2_50_49_14]